MTLLAIAHRAGNDLAALRTAVERGVDLLAADVHGRAGRLEVRHSKQLRPLPVLWDRGPAGVELTRTCVPQLELPALLRALDGPTPVMLDLKGPGRVGARVAELLQERSPTSGIVVCARWWPGLDAFAGLSEARQVLTARTVWELRRLLRRVQGQHAPYGVSLHGSLLTADVVAALRRRVEVVMSWGVNDDVALDRVLSMGVNGIVSDSPDVLRTVVASR